MCTVTIVDEYRHKHMVSLLLSNFCLEFIFGVCCGGLLIVASRGGQTFPKTMEFRNSVLVCLYFVVRVRAF